MGIIKSHACVIVAFISLFGLGWDRSPIHFNQPPPKLDPSDCRTVECIKENTPRIRYSPVNPNLIGGSDHFGYVWSDDLTTASWSGAWTDLQSSGELIWDGTDEESDLIQEVDLPFSFNYYEHRYNKVYISSNGIIGFDESIDDLYHLASFIHYPVPHDYYLPQNFLAPFWTDLKFVEAYHSGSLVPGIDGHGSFFAVEWYQVTDSAESTLMTFEVKLYENGDIAFLYDQLTNIPIEKSIGIEDPDGVDGLQYLINTSGLNEEQLILFERPAPSRRVKLFPRLQSEFNILQESTFKVKLRNTGDITRSLRVIFLTCKRSAATQPGRLPFSLKMG